MLRDELAGHATLAVMSLLGMFLYSVSYALIYAASAAPASAPVAVLEMWMSGTHLCSACGCCLAQALLASMAGPDRASAPQLAQAQTAVFLGIACSVSVLASGCLASATGAECAPYFGAAVAPRLAATGAMVWAIVMYASSLGAQPWGPQLSLGISGQEGLTASAAMGLVPWAVLGTLIQARAAARRGSVRAEA